MSGCPPVGTQSKMEFRAQGSIANASDILVDSVTQATQRADSPEVSAAAKPAQPLPHFEIKELQALLQRSPDIEEPGAEPQADAPQAKIARPATVVQAAGPSRTGIWMRRGLKAALGLALAVVLGWGPLNTLLTPASVGAGRERTR